MASDKVSHRAIQLWKLVSKALQSHKFIKHHIHVSRVSRTTWLILTIDFDLYDKRLIKQLEKYGEGVVASAFGMRVEGNTRR